MPNLPTQISLPPYRVLLLPGWLDSEPTHWQSRWEALHGFERVQQADWQWPRRGDWMARLDEVLLDDGRPMPAGPRPTVLVAHSLGAQLVAAWAAHSRLTAQVRAAMLVAPPDVERADMPPAVAAWRPVVRQRLPFTSLAVLSSDDPYCAPERAEQMAAGWGASVYLAGARGHLNGESGLADWPEGLALLEGLCEEAFT